MEIDSARGVSTTAVKYSPSNELSQTLTKLNLSSTLGCRASTLSDDEPLYDSVASDDDYYVIQVVAGMVDDGRRWVLFYALSFGRGFFGLLSKEKLPFSAIPN